MPTTGDTAVDQADRPDAGRAAPGHPSGANNRSVRRRAHSRPRIWIARRDIFDYLARARQSRLIVSERDEVESERDEAKLLDAVRHLAPTRQPGRQPGSAICTARDVSMSTGTMRGRGWRRRQRVAQLALGGDEQSGGMAIRCQPSVGLRGRVADWVAGRFAAGATKARSRLFVAATPGRAERTIELLKEYDVLRGAGGSRAEDARYAAVLVAIGASVARLPAARRAALQIYAEDRRLRRGTRAPPNAVARATKAFLSDLRDLKVGDFVVHVDHGIGMFVGLKQIGVGDSHAGIPRASLRRRRQAVRAGRAARSRAEILRRQRGRRSIELGGASVGARQDARSRRRCATWPRSC